MTTKERAKQVIDSLPDDASIDRIMHALYVNAKFSHGEEEVRQGQWGSNDNAKTRLSKWAR